MTTPSTPNKVILILCDALRNDIAREQMGYMEHLVEQKAASRFSMIAGLPTLSRPLYETIHTGTHAMQHGITSNVITRRSTMPNIFQIARDHGKVTAAAAYCWYSELYNRTPYDLVTDREQDDDKQAIQHGRFYREDDYPDIELFAAGGMLLQRYFPDYLLIHPMGIDSAGHEHGAPSAGYANQVLVQDQIIANLVPLASQLGYTIFVTGDHGMNENHQHNGTLPSVREVPFYAIPPTGRPALGDTGLTVSQLQIAPTVCQLLDLPIPDTMRESPLTFI
jgi:predicted AlkP superfamily pyrophosphatase or phosphodiesterase